MHVRSINRVLTLASSPIAAASTTHLALAQRHGQRGAVGGIACCGSVAVAIPIAILVLNIVLLVWVARDAKSRGMENSILWMLLVLATSFIGLIIYLSVRPKGDFISCANCGEKKLPMLLRCPHCGAGV